MAFGDLLGTLGGNASSIGATNDLTGSVAVDIGDLVYVLFGQQTNLTATGATDDLGNTYTPTNAGTDPGTGTGRAFWSRVTVAGTLTTITVAATASSNDWAAGAAVIEGPFAESPLDANPANLTDSSSPYTCPATGTLAQADEVVMAGMTDAGLGVATIAATSPNLLAIRRANSTNIVAAIGHQTVSATTSVAPEFTGSSLIGAALFTSSFMKESAGGGDETGLQTGETGETGDGTIGDSIFKSRIFYSRIFNGHGVIR